MKKEEILEYIKSSYTQDEIEEIYNKVLVKETADTASAEIYMITKSQCEEKIEELLQNIEQNRLYNNEMKELRYVRLNMFKFLNNVEYVSFLNNHMQVLCCNLQQHRRRVHDTPPLFHRYRQTPSP